MKNTRTIIIFVLVVTFSLFSASEEKLTVNFSAKDLNGNVFAIKDVMGEGPVIITFWAIWCTSCIKELIALNEILTQYHERGLKIVTVNNDSPKSLAKVKSFVKMKKWDFPVLLDPSQKQQLVYAVSGPAQ